LCLYELLPDRLQSGELGFGPEPVKKHKIVLAISIALSLQPQSLVQAEDPIPATAEQLLRMPAAFAGKEISVMGYYINSYKKGSCLFADAGAAKNSHQDRHSIWVDETTFNPGNPPSPPTGISELCALKDHYVRIVGHFNYRGANRAGFGQAKFGGGFGSNGLWPSEITNIVNFSVARKTPNDPMNPCGMYKKK